MQTLSTETPPLSRLFVVCGRSVEEDTLKAAFLPYGSVQNIKLIKDKGVCYVKYDKASSAALAMESLNGAVLNNGRGPKLKVLLADTPTPRGVQGAPKVVLSEESASNDPDNNPPRSRLFLVVPKTADAHLVHEELSRYSDLEYCKTDLIASKGVVFVKYSKASSALLALEEVAAKGMLGPYKVKVMLAEPKTKRPRPDLAAAMGLFGPVGALGHLAPLGLDPTGAMRLPSAAAAAGGPFAPFGLGAANSVLAAQQAAALTGPGAADYASLQGFMGFNNATGLAAVAAAAAAAGASPGGMELGNQIGLGFGLGQGPLMGSLTSPDGNSISSAGMAAAHTLGAAGGTAAGSSGMIGNSNAFQSSPGNQSSMGSVSSSLTNMNFPLGAFMGLSPGGSVGPTAAMAIGPHLGPQDSLNPAAMGQLNPAGMAGPALSQQRLFVVVHKSVSEEQLRLLFRQYPGMEYCDLKRDKATGKSKGYCYVNYSTPAAAAAAVQDLNGIEFPLGSGFRLKVMYAEIITGGATNNSNGSSTMAAAAAAAMLHSSSSSRSSVRTQSAGQLGSLVRVGSGPLSHSGSGTLGTPAGAMAGQLAGGSSGSNNVAGAATAAPGGPLSSSPAATPLGPHTVASNDLAAQMADSFSSMSLTSMSGPTPPTVSSGISSSDPGSDATVAAAAAAAAAHHYDLGAAAAVVGGGSIANSVARELMFNVS